MEILPNAMESRLSRNISVQNWGKLVRFHALVNFCAKFHVRGIPEGLSCSENLACNSTYIIT